MNKKELAKTKQTELITEEVFETTDGTIRRPLLIFTMYYDIIIPGKEKEAHSSTENFELEGTISDECVISYPSIDDVKKCVDSRTIFNHRYKRLCLDKSYFQILSQTKMRYMKYNYAALPVVFGGDPRELIEQIADYVPSRVHGGKKAV